MNEEQAKKIIEELENINENLDLDLEYLLKENIKDTEELLCNEYIEEAIDEATNFIYYGDAMDYLQKNDCMLHWSIRAIRSRGFDIEDINSCLLASSLQRENFLENFHDKRSIFDDIFENKKLKI